MAYGQYEEPQLLYSDGNDLLFITDIDLADLDGDGMNDVVIVASNGSRVSWFKNHGEGIFSNERIISDNTYEISSLLIHDINGDSTPDLIAVNQAESNVILFPNDGYARFDTSFQWHPGLQNLEFIEIADLDNDGTPDVIISGYYSERIAWFSNDGLGGLSFEDSLSTDSLFTYGIKAADIDGDGDMEILASTFANQYILLYNNLGGHFSNPIQLASPVDIKRNFDIADIDGDQDLDVIVYQSNEVSSNDYGYNIYYFENVGGTLADSANLLIPLSNIGNDNYVVEDFTGDGLEDIIYHYSYFLSDPPSSILKLFTNTGDGQFDNGVSLTSANLGIASMVAGDLSGDGFSDLVFSSNNQLLWLDNQAINNANGDGIIYPINDSTKQGRISHNYHIGDITGDGKKDVLLNYQVAQNPEFAFRMIENDNNEGFNEAENPFVPENPSQSSAFFVEDIDNDGISDILQAYNNNGIVWFKGDGQGGFDPEGNVSEFHEFEHLHISEVTDLDNNGRPDLLCLATIDNQEYIYILYNHGAPYFELAREISDVGFAPDQSLEVVTGDIDGDDDLDIVGVALLDEPKLLRIINEADTNFSEVVISSLNLESGFSTYIGIDLADLQGSGDMEMFVRFYKVDWVPCSFFICPIETYALLILDYADGAFDLIATHDNIPVYQPYFFNPYSSNKIVYGDFNWDGNADILSYNYHLINDERFHSIVWLLGDGMGQFPQSATVTEGFRVSASTNLSIPWLTYTDMDNDSTLDVFVLFGEPYLNLLSELYYIKNGGPRPDQDGDGYDISVDCDDNDSTIADQIPEPVPIQDIAVCEGESIQLGVIESHETFSYLWTGPNGFQSTELEPNIESVSALHNGEYSIVAIHNDCQSEPAIVHVVVDNLPAVELEPIDSNTLTATADNIIEYQWFFNGDTIPGATGPFLLLAENGNYQVAVIDENGCQSLSEEYSFSITAAQVTESSSWINIYPNPTSNTVKIEFHHDAATHVNIAIKNTLGQSLKVLSGVNASYLEIDLSEFPAGSYFISIENNKDGFYTKEVILR